MSNTPLEIAISEIGMQEAPDGSNRTKYGEWYGETAGQNWDGQPWCGMFVSWCFDEAGTPLPELQAPGYNGFASVAIGLEAFRQRGWLVDDPEPGYIAFMDVRGNGKPNHVGIVEMSNSCCVVTVEGNTAPPSGGKSSHVARRLRKRALCLGFGRPNL